jgi:hypothetical protein
MIYEPREYRRPYIGVKKCYTVCVADSDLYIISDSDETQSVIRWIRQLRSAVVIEIQRQPDFLETLIPLAPVTEHPLVVRMAEASRVAGVGPMAAVAGAIAEGVGLRLIERGVTAIVENGGDLFIANSEDITVRLMAGTSSLTNHMGIRIRKDQMPVGLCTSSGTVGHSLSFGKADAVVILSKNTALADAVATATGNRVQSERDIETALQFAMGIEGILGAVIVVQEVFGAVGDIQLVNL